MNTLNEMFRKIGKTFLPQAMLACVLPLAMPAQNLIQNPGFEKAAAGVPPGTPVSYTNFCTAGGSAAAIWTIYVNSCGANISTTLEPSTAPNGGNYMMHVVTTNSDNGIVTTFATQPQTTASAWVFVNSGCVGMGTGDGAQTYSTDEMTCVTGHWIHFSQVPNGVSPASEFIVYSVLNPDFPTGLGGADFYVDNVKVVAAPNGAPVQ